MWRVTSRLICLFWVATVISGCASDKLLNVRTLSKAPKGEIVFLKKVGSWEVTDKFESTDSATERISIDKENKQIAVLYTNVTGNSYVSKKSGGRSNALKGFLACETDDINRIEDSYNPCNSSFYITDRTSTALSQTIGSALLLGLPTLAEAVKGSYWFHVNFAPNLVLSAAKEAGLIQDGSWNVVFPHYSYATFANANRKDVPKFASNPKIDKKRKSNETAKIVIPKTQQQPKLGSSGSGFFVSRMGHVVTNAHVVKDCSRLTIGDNANKQTAVELISTDSRNDLALLKPSSLSMTSAETKSLISKLGIKLVPLAGDGLLRSDDVELGEKVMVAGFPYGDFYSNTIKVTRGIVSAVRGMGDDSGQFQMDAAAQAGNSGGPIYDESGNIVGVVVSQLNKFKIAKAMGSLPENVNFGIKASTVRQFLTSSGLPTKWSERDDILSTKELAKTAQQQTLMVMCY